MQAIGLMWFHLVPWVFTCWTRSFIHVCCTGWVSEWRREARNVQHAKFQQTLSKTTKLAVEATETYRIHRHDSICDALSSAAKSVNLTPQKKLPSLIASCSSRPADVVSSQLGGEQAYCLRHSCHLPSANQHPRTAASQGHVLSVGKEQKVAAHLGACHSVGKTTRHLFQRLFIFLWRGNTILWLH